MPSESPVAVAASLHRGDHACWVYGARADHAAVLQAFLTSGLPAQERLLYFGSPVEVRDVLAGLGAAQHDPDALLQSGRLVVGDVADAYLRSGRFDPAECVDGFREVSQQATADGYSGIRVAGENTSMLDDPRVLEQWYDYELQVEVLIAAEPIVGLCCFDRSGAPERTLRVLDAIHRVPFGPQDGRESAFTVHGRADGSLALGGEIDALNAAELTQVLRGRAAHAERLVVDLSTLEFIDSAGVRALERLARARVGVRPPVVLVGASDFLRQVWPLLVPNAGESLELRP